MTAPHSLALPGAVEAELESARDRVDGRPARNEAGDLAGRAMEAFAGARYREAAKLCREVLGLAPGAPSIVELLGLSEYELGKWQEAAKILTAHVDRTGDPAQIPVIMDAERALGHFRAVERLYEQLRRASPEADVLAEGRMVAAGALADSGRLDDAIALLEATGARRPVRRPKDRHLRQWYVLADLYERAGEVGLARELFKRVRDADPEVGDVRQRLKSIGGG